jgi:hypothetical protein
VTEKGHVMPLNVCARSHIKVCLIVFVQWCTKCGGALMYARAHNGSTLERTVGALEPRVSMKVPHLYLAGGSKCRALIFDHSP